MRQNKTEKTDQKDGEDTVSCIKTKKFESWLHQQTKYPLQSIPSVKDDQALHVTPSLLCDVESAPVNTILP
jgi:hypothetical protein